MVIPAHSPTRGSYPLIGDGIPKIVDLILVPAVRDMMNAAAVASLIDSNLLPLCRS